MRKWRIGFGWGENAGLVCVWNADEREMSTFALHLAVRPEYWQLGNREYWHDGTLYSFGLGPLLLITWME